MKRIAVFCGSNTGLNGIYAEEAKALGKLLAEKNIELVYGGSKVGLMGVLADNVIRNGGWVTGVIPDFLMNKEIVHQNLSELIIVSSMHERKLKMSELSEGVMALPGGFGTLDELFEMLTWGQLGLHGKPAGILNTNGFYDFLLMQIQTMVDNGFLKEINARMLLFSKDKEDLLNKMTAYTPSGVKKWIGIDQT